MLGAGETLGGDFRIVSFLALDCVRRVVATIDIPSTATEWSSAITVEAHEVVGVRALTIDWP